MDQEKYGIMVHGVPNVEDAAIRLREELDQYEQMFGEVQWVRMGQNRGFHRTNYAFVRYRNTTVHRQVVEHFNRNGIANTRIWMEINPRPTEAHHLLQDIPATPRVAQQLEELERLREELVGEQENALQQLQQQLQQANNEHRQLREQLEEARGENTHLVEQLANSQTLVNELLNARQTRNVIEFVEPPRSPSPRARHNRDPVRAWRPFWEQQRVHNPRARHLDTPPTTRVHRLTGGPCPICLETFENCNSVVETVCGHRACESCMFQNIHFGNNNCPLCREPLGQVQYRRVQE